MNFLNQYIGKVLDLELSGDKKISGILVELGQDLAVIFNGYKYFYIPLLHVQFFKLNQTSDLNVATTKVPIESQNKVYYRNILSNARGKFVELYVSGNLSIHGYVTNIMTNYFVFYSPIYKNMFISMNHLKWLVPYYSNQTPYSLQNDQLPVNPISVSLSRTFEEQLEKLIGKIVIFDLGQNPNKIGLLKNISDNVAELVTADENALYCRIEHLKTAHSPSL
jgi:hypothetical protein